MGVDRGVDNGVESIDSEGLGGGGNAPILYVTHNGVQVLHTGLIVKHNGA